jgi:hypothetical protein
MFSNYFLDIVVISAKKLAASVKIGENAQKTHFPKRAFSLHNVGKSGFLLTNCISLFHAVMTENGRHFLARKKIFR